MNLDRDALLWGLQRLARTDRRIDALPVRSIAGDLPALADALWADILGDRYVFEPLDPFVHRLSGKDRTLYRAGPLDQALLFSLARVLTLSAEPLLSDACYSYRRGRSAWGAQRRVVDFVRPHKDHRALGERGVYVIRSDISSYGESIRVDDDSPLWQQLEKCVPDGRTLRLVRSAIRQPVRTDDGTATPLVRGVPTGSPIQPPVANLYLTPTDERMSATPGLGYVRYGDDLLLLHHSWESLEDAFGSLEAECATLGLQFSHHKTRRWCFNGAGRILDPRAAAYRPTQSIEYLGARVSFSGAISPNPEKRRRFLARVRARLVACDEALGDTSLDHRGSNLCLALRRALDGQDPLCEPYAAAFFADEADRESRLALVGELELLAASIIARKKGRRAFRMVSPRKLRAWGFPRLDVPRTKMKGKP